MLIGGWESNRWPTQDEAYNRPDTTYQKEYGNWDPNEWKKQFNYLQDKRQPRKEVFATTILAVKAGQYTTE